MAFRLVIVHLLRTILSTAVFSVENRVILVKKEEPLEEVEEKPINSQLMILEQESMFRQIHSA